MKLLSHGPEPCASANSAISASLCGSGLRRTLQSSRGASQDLRPKTQFLIIRIFSCLSTGKHKNFRSNLSAKVNATGELRLQLHTNGSGVTFYQKHEANHSPTGANQQTLSNPYAAWQPLLANFAPIRHLVRNFGGAKP